MDIDIIHPATAAEQSHSNSDGNKPAATAESVESTGSAFNFDLKAAAPTASQSHARQAAITAPVTVWWALPFAELIQKMRPFGKFNRPKSPKISEFSQARRLVFTLKDSRVLLTLVHGNVHSQVELVAKPTGVKPEHSISVSFEQMRTILQLHRSPAKKRRFWLSRLHEEVSDELPAGPEGMVPDYDDAVDMVQFEYLPDAEELRIVEGDARIMIPAYPVEAVDYLMKPNPSTPQYDGTVTKAVIMALRAATTFKNGVAGDATAVVSVADGTVRGGAPHGATLVKGLPIGTISFDLAAQDASRLAAALSQLDNMSWEVAEGELRIKGRDVVITAKLAEFALPRLDVIVDKLLATGSSMKVNAFSVYNAASRMELLLAPDETSSNITAFLSVHQVADGLILLTESLSLWGTGSHHSKIHDFAPKGAGTEAWPAIPSKSLRKASSPASHDEWCTLVIDHRAVTISFERDGLTIFHVLPSSTAETSRPRRPLPESYWKPTIDSSFQDPLVLQSTDYVATSDPGCAATEFCPSEGIQVADHAADERTFSTPDDQQARFMAQPGLEVDCEATTEEADPRTLSNPTATPTTTVIAPVLIDGPVDGIVEEALA